MSTRKPLTQAELHNQLAPELVATIVRCPLDMGGDLADVSVLTESVLIGVVQAIEGLTGRTDVLDAITGHARTRLAQLRLTAAAKGPKQ